MSNPQHFNGPVWDRLLDLIYACDDTVTDAEVDDNLKRFGIDMQSANLRLHRMMAEHRARASLAAAKEARPSIVDRIRNVVAPRIDELRTGVKELIGRALNPSERLAYFHKLESVASEQDLESLLDDLEKLAAIRERDDRNESSTK